MYVHPHTADACGMAFGQGKVHRIKSDRRGFMQVCLVRHPEGAFYIIFLQEDTMKKITAFIVTLMLTVSMMAAFVSADDATIKVKFRIEGVSENIYYDTFETATTTLTDVLKELDAASDDITMTITESQYGNYLSSLNGIDEGSHGDMSGWMFMVNGADSDVGMDYVTLKDGDSVVLYFADPYGAGFQKPKADVSKIADGVIKFTSDDTVYDADWNPSVVTNPVTGMTVKWYTDDENYTEYTTDADGTVTIAKEELTAGEHKLAIEKKAENGAPLVLALEPDYTVTVEAADDVIDNGGDVGTADSSMLMVYVLCAAFAACAAVAVVKENKIHEN